MLLWGHAHLSYEEISRLSLSWQRLAGGEGAVRPQPPPPRSSYVRPPRPP